MENRNWFQSFLTISVIFGITTLLYLYTSGYRMTRTEERAVNLEKTGMISSKSIPLGASVYLNGVLISATNDTISGIEPGIHNLKILKKGFITWSKDIEVFPELVTDITAVLISQSPRLEPLTNTGARNPTISSSLNKIAYFSKDGENSGVTIIPLAQEGLNLFRSNPATILKDTPRNIYSNGISIEWSPDEKSLLIEGMNDIYYLVDISTGTAESTSSPNVIKNSWADILAKKRKDFIEKLELPEDIRTLAVSPDVTWSPDGKKFLYIKEEGGNTEYRVFNMEKPIPVGEKADNLVFSQPKTDLQPKVTWYADSFHLIITEGDVETDKRGSISLIRIDGTNKTEIYNNTLYTDQVFSAPAGDKIIILTSFKSGDQTDLYTVSIR